MQVIVLLYTPAVWCLPLLYSSCITERSVLSGVLLSRHGMTHLVNKPVREP